MSSMGTIVAIITVLGSLFLVTRGSTFQSMKASQTVKLAAIWAAIILGLVLLISFLQH
ncbi:hypothetical protein [Novosphingobium sp. 9]|uniref:hypothetical protein n=1 Tax=Novosphingobium sp. 9 TaxID=2025349 RepID=UPI0021B5BC3E|nr:hypothetical protein [Novosphingobium sp. 9]